MATFWERHGNIFIYVPNLIGESSSFLLSSKIGSILFCAGYARVLFTLYSYAVAYSDPRMCVAFYFCAFARRYKQTSTFGAVLDMVTDRLATTGLLAILASMYSQVHMIFLLLVWLDIFSHWYQMYSSLLFGEDTHKDVNSRAWLVRMYYKHRLFMGFCCVCCEVLYLSLYLLKWPAARSAVKVPIIIPQSAFDLVPGLDMIADSEGISLVALLALLAFPGFGLKQVCNWVQLQMAAQSLVEADLVKDKLKSK